MEIKPDMLMIIYIMVLTNLNFISVCPTKYYDMLLLWLRLFFFLIGDNTIQFFYLTDF